METSSFDFAYLESDPRTQQPSACVYLKAAGAEDYAGVKADRLIAAQCLTLIPNSDDYTQNSTKFEPGRRKNSTKHIRLPLALSHADVSAELVASTLTFGRL